MLNEPSVDALSDALVVSSARREEHAPIRNFLGSLVRDRVTVFSNRLCGCLRCNADCLAGVVTGARNGGLMDMSRIMQSPKIYL
jgi:hypothetical protein